MPVIATKHFPALLLTVAESQSSNSESNFQLRSVIDCIRLWAAISARSNAMNRIEKIDDNMLAKHKSVVRQSMAHLRLRKHADYQRAYAASRKRQSPSMSWFLSPHDPAYAGETPRIGLTAGKVLGKAHERNRIKRRMREVLRRHTELFPEGCDLIFHPRRIVLTMDFGKLEAEIVRILEQANTEAEKISQRSVEAGPSQ